MAKDRKASFACGAWAVTVSGDPVRINACSCFRCQTRSASAFSYTAFFPVGVARIEGPAVRWKGTGAFALPAARACSGT